MAIIQISKIQVRRGLQEDLPQPLASAEFGWSIDERRLFIGNGTAEEGAPIIGNTEILTTYSDIFSLNGVYTFKGLAAGYPVQTGPSHLSPASRSMQDKFDDLANFRDFGGIGDGVTNEVNAFNRAITQLYRSTLLLNEPRVRRTLYIPAGTYLLSGDVIRLLPYVKLKGDGKNSTFIIQTDATQPCTLMSADSKAQIGQYIGQNGAVYPDFMEISDLSLLNNTDGDIIQFDSVTNVTLNSVRMRGAQASPTVVGNLHSCVNIKSQVRLSFNIAFTNCDFANQIYGVYTNSKIYNVNFIGGSFTQLYRGINLGEANVGDAQPTLFKITQVLFEDIAKEAIYTSNTYSGVTNVVSAFNSFRNVGNLFTTTPYSAIINFGGDNSYSIGDTFNRAYDAIIQSVNLNGNASFATLPNGRIQLGKQLSIGGQSISLLDNTSINTLAGVVGVNDNPTIVEYSITRASASRLGLLKIVPNGGSVVFDDEYVETADTGITIIPVVNNGIIELQYSSTSTGIAAVLNTTSRTIVRGPQLL